VSLLMPAEHKDLHLDGEASACRRHGMRFRSLPIPDMGVPQSATALKKLVSEISGELNSGKTVVVHCRQGVGRSSMVAASVLASFGEDADHAFQRVEQSRGCPVPGTAEQANWVRKLAETEYRPKTACREAFVTDKFGPRRTIKFDPCYARRVAAKLASGKVRWKAVRNAKLFTDVDGRHWSLARIVPRIKAAGWRVTSSQEGDRVGCVVHQQKLSFVFSSDTLARFGARDDARMAQVLSSAIGGWTDEVMSSSPLQDAARLVKDDRKLVPEQEWTLKQAAWMRIADRLSELTYRRMLVECGVRGARNPAGRRSVRLGSSLMADGWTDGKSYIAVSKEFLSELRGNPFSDATAVADLILHEYCHGDADTGKHSHDREFYKAFHDLHQCANDAAAAVFRSIPTILNGGE